MKLKCEIEIEGMMFITSEYIESILNDEFEDDEEVSFKVKIIE